MSERARSEAKLKRIAFKDSNRVLAVHCGFCRDENGKPDRRKKLGWLTFCESELGNGRFWWNTVSLTPPHFFNGLSCPKCKRCLDVDERQAQAGLTAIFLTRYREDKRTSLRALATELAAGNYLSERNENSLRIADEPRF